MKHTRTRIAIAWLLSLAAMFAIGRWSVTDTGKWNGVREGVSEKQEGLSGKADMKSVEPPRALSSETDAAGPEDKGATRAARIDDLLAIDNPKEREYATYEYLRDLSFDELVELFTSRERLPSSPRMKSLLRAIWRQLGSLNGVRAFEQLKAMLDNNGMSGDVLRHVQATVNGWALSAPQEAFAFLNEDLTRGHPISGRGLAAWLETLMKEGRHELASSLVSEIRPDARRVYFTRLVRDWIRYDLDRVGEWINELPDSQGRTAALSIYVTHWSARNPEDAAEWALNLDEDVRDRFMPTVARQWVHIGDSNDIADWIAVQPAGPSLDHLVYSLALRLDSDEGNSLARKITDPELRLKYAHLRSEKAVVKNLQYVASSAQQFMLDTGKSQVRYNEFLGEGKVLPDVLPVSGETYEHIEILTNTTRISVTTPEGKRVHYDF